MLLSTLFVQTLLALSVLALPSARDRLERRMARRGLQAKTSPAERNIGGVSGLRTSRPLRKVANVTRPATKESLSYSSNWGGAVLNEAAGTWSEVTASFVVPTPQSPPGQSGDFAASAWVGIDGDSCQTAILQTGLDFFTEDGAVSYAGWFEWFPYSADDFDDISFGPGDTVTVTVIAYSTTEGVAFITNDSNGQEVGVEIQAPYALCLQDAEWIVEDFEENGGLVPFANFGTVTFSNAVAVTTSDEEVGTGGANEIDIYQNAVLTSVSVGSSSVTVSYIG